MMKFKGMRRVSLQPDKELVWEIEKGEEVKRVVLRFDDVEEVKAWLESGTLTIVVKCLA